MLDLSPEKIMVLAVLALVVLGPNRLPGAARTMGRMLGQLRSMSSSLQSEVREALHEPHEAFNSALTEFRPVTDLRRGGVRRVVTDNLLPRDPPAGGPPALGPNQPGEPGQPPATDATGATGAPGQPPPTSGFRGSNPGGGIPDDPAFN